MKKAEDLLKKYRNIEDPKSTRLAISEELKDKLGLNISPDSINIKNSTNSIFFEISSVKKNVLYMNKEKVLSFLKARTGKKWNF